MTTSTDLTGCTPHFGGSGAGPHALTSLTCTGATYPFNYDARGNIYAQSYSNATTYAYTSFNKPRNVVLPLDGSATEYFIYDAGHNRVRKRSYGARPTAMAWDEVVYVGDGRLERRKDDTTTDYVHYIEAGGRTLAQMTFSLNNSNGQTASTGWRFFHQDALGSVEVTTDDAGNVLDRTGYDAWGARRNPNGTNPNRPGLPSSTPASTKVGYTGHNEDDELRIVDMGGRLYEPVLKRFLQADSVVQDVAYGPSWNRYSYVFNNPLRYTDPTGHEAELTVAVPTNLSGNELKAFVKELESAGLEVKADDKGKIQVTLHTTADADAAGFILGSLYGEAVAKAVHDSAASNAGTAARGGAERGRTNAAWSGEAEDAYQRMKSDPQFKSVIPTSPLGVGTDQIVKATPSGSGNLFLLMVGALKGLKGAPTKGPPTEGAPTESAATGGDGLVNEGAQLPVGRKGAPLENAPFQPVRNTPTEIGGRTYTGPALDQMQNRGLTPSVVEDTIAHGARTAGRDGAAIFTTDQARVIVNPNGSVKTVMPFSN